MDKENTKSDLIFYKEMLKKGIITQAEYDKTTEYLKKLFTGKYKGD